MDKDVVISFGLIMKRLCPPAVRLCACSEPILIFHKHRPPSFLCERSWTKGRPSAHCHGSSICVRLEPPCVEDAFFFFAASSNSYSREEDSLGLFFIPFEAESQFVSFTERFFLLTFQFL